jgi:SSS family solute:Na+ symporter
MIDSTQIIKVSAIIVYLAILAILGIIAYRRTKTASDYLVAGRRAHPVVMALSYGATFISTSAIVVSRQRGRVRLQPALADVFEHIPSVSLSHSCFSESARAASANLNAHTFPEFLGSRFKSRFIRIHRAGDLHIMPLYASAVMIGVARILKARLAGRTR